MQTYVCVNLDKRVDVVRGTDITSRLAIEKKGDWFHQDKLAVGIRFVAVLPPSNNFICPETRFQPPPPGGNSTGPLAATAMLSSSSDETLLRTLIRR